MKTLRDVFREGPIGRAMVSLSGHSWRLEIAVDGKTAILTRTIPIPNHYRRSRYVCGGSRTIEIRRPLDMAV